MTLFYEEKKFDTNRLEIRGPPLRLVDIPRDNRYLISEMACKSYGTKPLEASDLRTILTQSYRDFLSRGGKGKPKVRDLLEDTYLDKKYPDKKQQLLISADELLERDISSEEDLDNKYLEIAKEFEKARASALQNTQFYLSMVNDLDVYVATSMRNRQNFREMADVADRIFKDQKLRKLNLRYFDPTLSAADGHEDKGLIECLMVKCSKVLIYVAGEKESFGKDAEAAMALSLGKPVIFYCTRPGTVQFYRDIHPLTRLIHFETGVAVGSMVATSVEDVVELLRRIFYNEMQYNLLHDETGYLRLKERLTNSTVRLQTSDKMLRETFWNYYQEKLR